jgi:hypothetical protein
MFRRCRPLPPANTTHLVHAITRLQTLTGKKQQMTAPTGNVQIAQADLDNFTSEINTAVTTISGYITTLLANQSTPLPAADESALTAAVAALDALEPPAPASD